MIFMTCFSDWNLISSTHKYLILTTKHTFHALDVDIATSYSLEYVQNTPLTTMRTMTPYLL